MDNSVSGIGVLDKAVALLDVLEHEPLALNELTVATGLPRATVHRLARALEIHGFVERDELGRFGLGHRVAAPSLAGLASPTLERLRDETGESVQLYVPRGGVRVCIASLESPHSLRTMVEVGAALPMDVGSAAKALAGATSRTGWVQSVEERERGVASVSSPVVRGGMIVAAVSVSGPVERTTRSPGRRYGAAVATAAATLSNVLGGSIRPLD